MLRGGRRGAGAGTGPRFVIAQVPKNHRNLCTPPASPASPASRGRARGRGARTGPLPRIQRGAGPRYMIATVPEVYGNGCTSRVQAQPKLLRNKDEQFCFPRFPRFARASARAGREDRPASPHKTRGQALANAQRENARRQL
jgi:hypothetical protein